MLWHHEVLILETFPETWQANMYLTFKMQESGTTFSLNIIGEEGINQKSAELKFKERSPESSSHIIEIC